MENKKMTTFFCLIPFFIPLPLPLIPHLETIFIAFKLRFQYKPGRSFDITNDRRCRMFTKLIKIKEDKKIFRIGNHFHVCYCQYVDWD
jgi:hypothetical protein